MAAALVLKLLTLMAVFDGPGPLLNYQEMQALKERIAALTVEIEVRPTPPPGARAELTPRLHGQGVCIENDRGERFILTSQFLVENPMQLRVRAAGADWVDSELIDTSEALGVARIKAPESFLRACEPVVLAPDEFLEPDVFVFCVDDPATIPNIFWGQIASKAEPPLTEFLLTTTGLPLGHPLYNARAEFVALNLRRYAMASEFHLAATARQIRDYVSPPAQTAPEP